MTASLTAWLMTYPKMYRHEYYIRYASNIVDNISADVITQKEDNNEVLNLREYYGNNEIVGKINIPGTGINEAIVRHSDNDYYLHHDNYGRYEINGSIFLDYRLNLDSRKVLIYGHSSVYDDIPFNELEKYYDKSFYDSHKYIRVVTLDNEYEYEIFSVYVETSNFTYMNLKINNDLYNKYLKEYKNKSLYDTGVEVNDNDELIILQTCSNSSEYIKYKKKYLLVIARKVKLNREV